MNSLAGRSASVRLPAWDRPSKRSGLSGLKLVKLKGKVW